MGCLLLFIIIVGFPVAEFMVVARMAAQIGFGDTVVLLVISAVFGAYLARHQGKVVLSRVQQCMAEGRTPTLEMIDGLLVFLGGLLFVFPGFISDVLGLIFVFPLTRWAVRWLCLAGFKSRVQAFGPTSNNASRPPRQPQGIDRAGAEDAEVL